MANSQGPQADLFSVPESPMQTGMALAAWQPRQWPVAADWQPLVDGFLSSPVGQGLAQWIRQRLSDGATIYPPQPLRALAQTPLAEVKVVIVGQDPYHGPGQAEGLAFSVAPGMALPPSLRNIFKELARELEQASPAEAAFFRAPPNGSLAGWAQQGVLLLNTCLTVEQGQPASHAGRGWEVLTQAIVEAVLQNGKPVVFLLWGANAQKMAALVKARSGQHAVLTANHPSPLSAMRAPHPFIGCGHFGQANVLLAKWGVRQINW